MNSQDDRTGRAAPVDDLDRLIEAARAGDQAACAALYRAYVHPIYRLVYGLLLNEQDAEEVVQDTFAYALRTLDRFDPELSAFRTWLYTIAVSRSRNKRRRRWLRTINLAEVAEWLPGFEPPPDKAVEDKGVRDLIWQALGRLSPKLREAVILRYFDGLTYREMGEVLGCPQKTAESRVRLAHEALYHILAEQADALPEGLLSYE